MPNDQAIAFFFKNIPVRGHICRLNTSITESLSNHLYPIFAQKLLAEMAAVTQCFSMDIKDLEYHGTMQITGSGFMKMALVDSHLQNHFRCCATFNDQSSLPENISLPLAFGDKSQLVLTIDIKNNRYQTVVSLTGENLETTLQHYFLQSQQIPTIVLCKSLANNNSIVSGALILQRIPESQNSDLSTFDDLWHELAILTSTLKNTELLDNNLPLQEILHRLYHTHDVVVSRETTPVFSCSCSLEKVKNVIAMLNEDDQEYSRIVACDYCGKVYQLGNQ